MPFTLSTPTEGGRKPDLRRLLRGKVIAGTGSSGTPMKLSTAPSACPTSSSLSMLMLAARRIQSGIQPGPGSRRQVVKLALRINARSLSMKSTRSASPWPSFLRKR